MGIVVAAILLVKLATTALLLLLSICFIFNYGNRIPRQGRVLPSVGISPRICPRYIMATNTYS